MRSRIAAECWLRLAAWVLALAVAVPAEGQAPRPPLAGLVDQVQAFFPKLSGEVIEVRDQQLTLSLGIRDGLQPGVHLALYREGRELRHPKTGELLGRAEETLGRVLVTQVFEQYSAGTLVEGSGIQAGDKVRLSAGKIRLTLLPLPSSMRDAQVEAVVQELTEELNQTGRFQVMAGDALALKLAQDGIRAEEAVEGRGLAAARSLAAEYILAVLFKRIERKLFMEVRLFADSGATPFMKTALMVPTSVKPQPKGQFSADASNRPVPQAKPRSLLARLLGGDLEADSYSSAEGSIPLREVARVSYPVLAMDVAVAPRDKIPRVVLSEGDKVYQYRLVNQRLEPEWTFNARSMGTVISLQLADLDGDGVLEVVANRWDPRAGLNSFILTAKGETPKYLVEYVHQILYAIDARSEGVKRTVWAQRVSPQTFFTEGQADEVTVKEGKLVTLKPVRVPAAFRATGAVMSNIAGKDTRSLAFVDAYGRLRIGNEGEDFWQSATVVGGGYSVVELIRPQGTTTRSYFFKMEPAPLAVDLDGDGIDEIVIPQTVIKEGLLAVVFKGPAGFRLQSVNTGFEGGITAIGAFKTEDSAQPTLVASVVRFSNFFRTSGETQIIMTIPQE